MGTYITQNPNKVSLSISMGQQGVPSTTADPVEEPPDVLHEDINIVEPLFIFAGRIILVLETYPCSLKKKTKSSSLNSQEQFT